MKPRNQFTLPPVHKLPALNLGLRTCAPSDWLDGPDAFGDEMMQTIVAIVGLLGLFMVLLQYFGPGAG